MSTRLQRIPCTLVKDDVTYNTELNIKSALYMEGSAVRELEIADRRLTLGHTVPDGGPYTLRYFFNGKQHEERVRVKFRTLINA